MPQSLVLNLVPETQIAQKYLNGQALRRLFLSLVSAVDPELGYILQTDSQNRAFTLSPLQHASHSLASSETGRYRLPQLSTELQYQYQTDILPGAPCWWRIAWLDDELFGHLSPLWQETLPQRSWYLGSARLNITSLACNPQQNPDWASRCSYQALYQQASERQREIQLQFLTPASFHQAGYASPMPTRDLLFHCLRRRWNRHSGLAFAPNVVTPIVPTDFQLHTVALQDLKTRMIGCLGRLRFQILGDVDPLTIKRINTLADFTRYCSVGCHTTTGMGLVNRFQSATGRRQPITELTLV